MRTLLVDADTLVYQVASAAEVPIQWDDWLFTLHSDFNECKSRIADMIASLSEDLSADRIILALTDAENWRKSVMPTYKFHRKSVRKPVCFHALREYLTESYEVFQRPTLEGDDVLGILATHPKLVPGEKIIVSIDKDMKTVPGYHLNDMKARDRIEEGEISTLEEAIVEVSEAEATYWHLFQTLTGDTTDGYKGCPGYGPVTAKKLLGIEPGDPVDMPVQWPKIVAAYVKAGLNEAEALQNARVARIVRAHDWDFQKKGVRLWSPPVMPSAEEGAE